MPDFGAITVDHCREQARVALERASRTESEKSREEFLAVAMEWLKLAADISSDRGPDG